MIAEILEQGYLSDRDTDTHHVCGTCGELKPLDAFYKDGTTPDGKVKYRRDCKECYKKARLWEARLKKRNEKM